MLDVNHVSFAYHEGHPVLCDITFSMERGEFVSILGANGCGKTTLLRSVMGFLKPKEGCILLDGTDTQKMDERELARKVSYIPQAHNPPFAFTVMDVVMMGRTPHLSRGFRPSKKDRMIAEEAMEALDILRFANRNYTQLSGGQRQMVVVARALAQEPSLLIMDEPTSSLDFGNQYIVLSQVKKLAEKGVGVLMVTHDPAHAVFCADRILAMKEGVIVCSGNIGEVITEPVMQEIYGMDIRVRSVDLEAEKAHTVCIPEP